MWTRGGRALERCLRSRAASSSSINSSSGPSRSSSFSDVNSTLLGARQTRSELLAGCEQLERLNSCEGALTAERRLSPKAERAQERLGFGFKQLGSHPAHNRVWTRSLSMPTSQGMQLTGGRQPLLQRNPHHLQQLAQQQQRRGMFIQTQTTPNPSSLMFLPATQVLPSGTMEFTSGRAATSSPLALRLFRVDGVKTVFLGPDFITISKAEDASWDVLKPDIFAAIMDFFSSGRPVVLESADGPAEVEEEDDEIVAMIKELLETRIRPAVQEDGGDIDFHSFDFDSGVVKLRMKGACSGCPSSSVTLKSGVENMLMHYVPEVTRVEQIVDDDDEESEELSH